LFTFQFRKQGLQESTETLIMILSLITTSFFISAQLPLAAANALRGGGPEVVSDKVFF
jgi:hypothetical protein